MSRRFFSISEVAAAYRPRRANELRTEWAIAVLYRPISLLVTPAFAAIGASPAFVSMLGLAVAALLPFIAMTDGDHVFASVGIAAIVFCVLDCVDGDLARVTGRSSRRGAYLDFIIDLAYRAGFYAAIGIAADRTRAAGGIEVLGAYGGIVAGLVAALVAIVARSCRLYVEGGGHGPERGHANPAMSGGDILIAFLSGLDHLLPVIVLALGAMGRLDWALVWLLVASIADLAHTQVSVWKRLA